MNKITLILIFVGLSLGFQSCNSSKSKVDNKLISVSILPQKYFIERIAGDDFKVNVLIPPGASPASYEPTPKQMKDMSASSVYLRIGHIPFEKAWLNKLFEGNDHIKSLDMSEGIELSKALKFVMATIFTKVESILIFGHHQKQQNNLLQTHSKS